MAVEVRDSADDPLEADGALDEAAARQIVEVLPTQKTPDFFRTVAEQSAFESALETLGTRSVVMPALVATNCVVFACSVFASSASQLAVAFLAGVLALVGLSWPLVHPSPAQAAELRFRNQLRLFGDDEPSILAAQSALDQLEKARKIIHREWGRRHARRRRAH